MRESPERRTGALSDLYSVHVRTRKFRNLAKTKRYVVPAPRANSKTQGGTRIDSDLICHRHHSVFRVFKRSEYIPRLISDGLILAFEGTTSNSSALTKFLITEQGLPAASTLGGTVLVTTLPAPIIAPSPIVTPGEMMARQQSRHHPYRYAIWHDSIGPTQHRVERMSQYRYEHQDRSGRDRRSSQPRSPG